MLKQYTLALLLVALFLVSSFSSVQAQCSSSQMFVGGNANCNGTANLSAYDNSGSATSYRWYKKLSSGSWSYLAETPSEWGSGSYSTNITSTTIFGVSFYNSNAWCESSKVEFSVTLPSKPSVWGEGSSCTAGQANVQAYSNTSGVTFYLYKYENSYYNNIANNTSGTFTINNFYPEDATNYYVRAQKSGCWSGYSSVYIESGANLSAPTVSGNSPICKSGSQTLTASGGTEGNYRWYNSSNQLISGATSSSYNTGTITSSKTYKVSYIAQGMLGAGCESPKQSVTVSVINPSIPTAYDVSSCNTNSVTLRASSGHPGYDFFINGESNASIQNTPNNTATVTNRTVNYYTVKSVYSDFCRSNPSNQATINYVSVDNIQAGGTANCSNLANLWVSDESFESDITAFRWYRKSGSNWIYIRETTAEYGSSSTTYNISANTTFGVSFYDQNAGCESPKKEFTVNLASKPTVWADGNSCIAGQANIQASSNTAGVTFYLYKYENSSYNSIANNTSGTFIINNFNSGDASNYYVRAQISGCWSVGYSSVTIEIGSSLSAPTVSGNSAICKSGSRTLTASGGTEGNYRWYNSSNQLISGVTGSTYNTGNITSSKTYKVSYVEQNMNMTSCESAKRTVTVSVTNPTPPTANSISGCITGSVTLSASSGHPQYNWYLNGSSTPSGSPTSTNSKILNPSPANLSSYRVTSVYTVNGNLCESAQSNSAIVNLKIVPPPDLTKSGPSCGGGGNFIIYAEYDPVDPPANSNISIEFYTSATGGSPVHIDYLDFTQSQMASYGDNDEIYLASGSKDYWVSVYADGCRSEREKITLTVNPKPWVSADGYSCSLNNLNVQMTSANGGTYYLYRDVYDHFGNLEFAKQLVASNSTGIFNDLDISYEENENDVFFARLNSSGCWSDYREIFVDEMRLAMPTVSGQKVICEGVATTLTAFSNNGGRYEWYEKVGSNYNIIDSDNTLNTGILFSNKTYYVTYFEEGDIAECPSPRNTVTVKVNPKPNPPVAEQAYVTRCNAGEVTLKVTSDYNTYIWYHNNTKINNQSGATLTRNITTLDQELIFKVETKQNNYCISDPTEIQVKAVTNCENFVKEEIIRVPGKTTEASIENLDIDQKTTTYSYFDGLGRAEQTVVVKGSFSDKDIVQLVKYDDMGRQEFTYLPYTISNVKPGHKRTSPITEQAGFYAGTPNIPNDVPYSHTKFEPSPLSRVLKQGAPGAHWQLNSKPIEFKYQFNSSEEVIKWDLNQYGFPIVSSVDEEIHFPANTLYKNITIDEHGNQVIEFKNNRDQVLLKKVQESGTPNAIDHTGWLCTYYVYDDFDNLKVVIPPQAVAEIGSTYGKAKNSTFARQYYFMYNYDERQRMVKKQLPGGSKVNEVIMIYDQWDRLVLTQDGNQKEKTIPEYTFTKYDQLNRPIVSGVFATSNTLTQIQTDINNSNRYENKSASDIGYSLDQSYPTTVTSSNCRTVTYYDSYSFPFASETTYAYVAENGLGASYKNDLKVQVTGAMVKNLADNSWLKSITYYDQYVRPVQSINQTHIGGFERSTTVYDFVGNVLKTSTVYHEPNKKQLALADRFSYDHGNRLLDQRQTLAEEIQFKDQIGISISGTLITATASTNWGNSGAASINKLPDNTNGFVEFTATENNKARMCGLSNSNSNAHHNTIKYAIYLRHDRGVYIYESGSSKGKKDEYVPGDKFKVERRNSKIYYYKNEELLYTSAATETGALLADMAFYHSGATLRDVQMSLFEEVTVAQLQYNEIDNLIRKDLHQTASITGPLQEVDYTYNIRGWLSKINDQALPDASDLFGMQLFYQDGTNPQSNGNIGQVQWRNVTHQQQQGYAYNYDRLNRLTNATYTGTANGRYDVKITSYDGNGNIKSAERWGKRYSDEYGKIDKLTYRYYGNQLLRVEDSFNENYIGQDFYDDPDKPDNTVNDEYSYDANGNMQKDDNKGITNITYNEMNLPVVIEMEGNKRIEFAYTWAGEKLSKKVYENTTLLSTSHYLGAFLHDGTQVNQIITSEGRIVREINATTQQVQYIPEYHLKDHLGNTRLTFRPGTDEVYLATMETDDPEEELIEESQFRNLENTRVSFTPAINPNGGTKAARLNKDKPVGPAILLPVVPGDVIEIETLCYFEEGTYQGDLGYMQFLAMVATAYGGVAAGTEAQDQLYRNVTGATGIENEWLPNSSTSQPYAHLNYILFDKDYNYKNAGFKRVPANAQGLVTEINLMPDPISEPGYIYVFVSYSNESGGYVYFDDLQVTHHERLSVVQADDYYPFGMTMAGLEYRRGDIQDNDYLYQGKEYNTEHDLNWYDFHARMFDSGLGRWMVADPKAQHYSPYLAMSNNPLLHIDPDGLFDEPTNFWQKAWNWLTFRGDLNKPYSIRVEPIMNYWEFRLEMLKEHYGYTNANLYYKRIWLNATADAGETAIVEGGLMTVELATGPIPAGAMLRVATKGKKIAKVVEVTSNGAARIAKYGKYWQKASLNKAIVKHAGKNYTKWISKSGKTIYENPKTGRQIVVDPAGYFRIFQPKSFGSNKGVYLDMMGKIPSPARRVKGGAIRNVPLEGDEFEQATHFLID